MGVRLGKQVKRLEARAKEAADAFRDACGYVISYSPENTTLDRSKLAPGERVAIDVHEGSARGTVRTVERVARDADDEGDVYNLAGELVGHVIERDGLFFRYCLRDGACDFMPGSPDTEEAPAIEEGAEEAPPIEES